MESWTIHGLFFQRFGNLCDNAMEAVRSLPKQERRMELKMNYVNASLYLYLQNAVSAPVSRRAGKIVSTKTDAAGYGLGLKNVRKIVEEFHGTMEIQEGENSFAVKIILFGL